MEDNKEKKPLGIVPYLIVGLGLLVLMLSNKLK